MTIIILQVLLKECKYIEKKVSHITQDIKIFSSEQDGE